MIDLHNLLIQAINNDDLNLFKQLFQLERWQESITQIENYAGVSQYTPEITYNDCDVFKYAVHKNADKIFTYLLPLVDTDKHGDNYGWSVLGMAIKNHRYDYAHAIINHPNFNPYPLYHTNVFGFIDSRNQTEEHIEFLFDYLNKFEKWDFKNRHLVYVFSHLICYNESTYQRFNEVYKSKINNPEANILNIFQEEPQILAKEIFYNYFRPFILDKLDISDLRILMESVMNENIIFSQLFESEQAQEGLNYLIKIPDLLQKYFNNNSIMVSYLPLECIIFLENNGIDIWVEDDEHYAAIDYILKNDDLEDPATKYFLNKYTKVIYDKLEKTGRKSNLKSYCHQKLLTHKLPEKNIKIIHHKI